MAGVAFVVLYLCVFVKIEILTIFLRLQDNIKLIRRYEGCYYTRLDSYYIIFYFETDWSRILPLPSTTLSHIEEQYENTIEKKEEEEEESKEDELTLLCKYNQNNY